METVEKKTKNAVYVNLIEEKIKALKSKIAEVKVSEDIAVSTRSTQLYKLNRDRKTLVLLKTLFTNCKEITLSGDDSDTFDMLTSTVVGQKKTSVICKEGDKITDLLTQYADVKDVYGKLTKYCENNGLVLDCTNNTVVKQ